MNVTKVLVTRAPERAASLVERLRHAGLEPLFWPLIDSELLPFTLDDLVAGRFDWLVFASTTTLRALKVRARLEGREPLATLIPETTAIATVGPSTRGALENEGLPVSISPPRLWGAAGLAELLPCLRNKQVWLPQALCARTELERALRSAGAQVTVTAVYRTVDYPAAHPLREDEARLLIDSRPTHLGFSLKPLSHGTVQELVASGNVEAILATSPSTIARLAQHFSDLGKMRLIVVGATTAQAARNRGFFVHAVARKPTDAAMVEATLASLAPEDESQGGSVKPYENSRRVLMSFPLHRPRRMRHSAALRRLVAEYRVHPAQLILPVFVKEGLKEPQAVPSMPGVLQQSLGSLPRVVEYAVQQRLGGIMLFGVPEHRDAQGSAAFAEQGILNEAIRQARATAGEALVLMSDVCLDEFTDHGHCGLVTPEGAVDNDTTVQAYAKLAVCQARAGAHMVAPSGMMDGQVRAIRQALDEAGFSHVGILAYTAKYASAFYGPFRDAVDSPFEGNRRSYQMDPANRREARLEQALDIEEGADIVMVKPAMSALDIVADIASTSRLPVAAYQVSGEYAMIEAAAQKGWIDRRSAIEESILSIRRAGADLILTYWASEISTWLDELGA